MTAESRTPSGQTEYEIGHFIDGRTVAGSTGRWGDVALPATGEIQARVAFASPEEVDQAVDAAQRAFGEWSRVPVTHSRGHSVQGTRAPARASRRAGYVAGPRAWQGVGRCAGRALAWLRGRRLRLRDSSPAQGRVLRAGGGGDRLVVRAPTVGCRGRDHTLQLPGDAAALDSADRHRVRQHLCPQAFREGSLRAV